MSKRRMCTNSLTSTETPVLGPAPVRTLRESSDALRTEKDELAIKREQKPAGGNGALEHQALPPGDRRFQGFGSRADTIFLQNEHLPARGSELPLPADIASIVFDEWHEMAEAQESRPAANSQPGEWRLALKIMLDALADFPEASAAVREVLYRECEASGDATLLDGLLSQRANDSNALSAT